MRIKELRRAKNLTQEELAKEINVTQGAISQWEKGLAQPTSDKLPELAKALGCSIDELYGKSEVSECEQNLTMREGGRKK